MIRRGAWFARTLLAGVCLTLPAAAATAPGLPEANDTGLQTAPVDLSRHALSASGAAPKAAGPAPIVIANPLWGIPLSTLTATRDRPLFAPSRRPPPLAVVNAPVAAVHTPPPPPPPPEKLNLTLVGTVARGTDRLAVFVDPGTHETIRLHMGEGHQGWILHSVERTAVTLQKGDLTETVELPATLGTPGFTPNQATAAITPPPPPRPPPAMPAAAGAPQPFVQPVPPLPGAAPPPMSAAELASDP